MSRAPSLNGAPQKTGILWTNATWNPFVGCSIKSAGCKNCYAMRQAHRLEFALKVPAYQGTTQVVNGNIVWTGRINRASDRKMAEPGRLPHPAMIFVNSMSDFWHRGAKHALRAEALAVMRANPRHVFQVLTKRPEEIAPILAEMGETIPDNVWLGATVEDGRVKDRIDMLRAIPAKIRFLSVEPMIGRLGKVDLSGIHWVIVGGESGPGARPLNRAWVRELRDQCIAAGVAFFFKQWGEFHPHGEVLAEGAVNCLGNPDDGDGRWASFDGEDSSWRVGTKEAGSYLDGRQWHEFPPHAGPGL